MGTSLSHIYPLVYNLGMIGITHILYIKPDPLRLEIYLSSSLHPRPLSLSLSLSLSLTVISPRDLSNPSVNSLLILSLQGHAGQSLHCLLMALLPKLSQPHPDCLRASVLYINCVISESLPAWPTGHPKASPRSPELKGKDDRRVPCLVPLRAGRVSECMRARHVHVCVSLCERWE